MNEKISHPLIIGHRGAYNEAPENTLKGFKKAIELGADYIEFDVHQSQDGALVVIHDVDILRRMGYNNLIEQMTLKELQKLELGEGQRVPELWEVLRLAKGKVNFLCEIKAKGISEKVITLLRDEDVIDSIITDIFVEKIIQEIPLFLTDPDLQGANRIFIQAYVLRSEGNHKDCLAKIREGLEAVRDYIYNRYHLRKSTSVHNDFKQLFNIHASTVFDFTKIPEDNLQELEKIVDYLKGTVLLTVKKGNFGHHTLTRPHLLEENTSIFTLGLVASVIPYIIYLLT